MLYDVFICHASEDKGNFVRSLASKLKELHLEVWYDEFSLKVGDSLRESIDKGLSKSRYGIVVLSCKFFEKQWPKKELNGLVAREVNEDNRIILPIWHNITSQEILNYSPQLADIKAIESSKGIDSVCKELLKVIKPVGSPLLIARDMLIEAGLNPPVVTDEWWLDIVEASNRIPNGGAIPPPDTCWGRWTFPLPNWGTRGEERGAWLAWTACQAEWEKAAEKDKITQITRPEKVLKFINSYAGLSKICHENLGYLALYAPQLTVKGLSGEFEKDFDSMLKKAIKNKLYNWKEEIALRHERFLGIELASLACHFVQGPLFSGEVKYYEIFEYLIWFLTDESSWLPKKIHNNLKQGMKEWAVWLPSKYDDIKSEIFYKSILQAKDLKSFKMTKRVKESLLLCIQNALKRIDVNERPEEIMNRFVEEGIIGEYFQKNKRRTQKHKKRY